MLARSKARTGFFLCACKFCRGVGRRKNKAYKRPIKRMFRQREERYWRREWA